MKIKQFIFFSICVLMCVALVGCASTKSHKPSTPSKIPTTTTIPPPAIPGAQKPYQVNGVWYQPMANAHEFEEKGLASWYGEPFHGRKTSSGEVYNMYGLSAAHKTLPLGISVQVTNLLNGKSIAITVNDRGPFVEGRILDLSYGAAKELDCIGQGVVPVKIVALGVVQKDPKHPGDMVMNQNIDFTKGNFTFQVGAFSNKDTAEQLKNKLAQTHSNAHISPVETPAGMLYRVRVGQCSDLNQVVQQETALRNEGYHEIFIVAE